MDADLRRRAEVLEDALYCDPIPSLDFIRDELLCGAEPSDVVTALIAAADDAERLAERLAETERERDALRLELELARVAPPPWPFDDR